jgi:hypothetical protein
MLVYLFCPLLRQSTVPDASDDIRQLIAFRNNRSWLLYLPVELESFEIADQLALLISYRIDIHPLIFYIYG